MRIKSVRTLVVVVIGAMAAALVVTLFLLNHFDTQSLARIENGQPVAISPSQINLSGNAFSIPASARVQRDPVTTDSIFIVKVREGVDKYVILCWPQGAHPDGVELVAYPRVGSFVIDSVQSGKECPFWRAGLPSDTD